MGNESFTKGVWYWGQDEHGHIESLGPDVLSASTDGSINVWNDKDARLIEMSPDLYAMVARCKDYIERYTMGDSASASMIAEIETLLSKARGEQQ